MLNFFDGAVAAGAANGVPAGIFLPVSDLPGVVAGEFGAGESQVTKEGKAMLSYLNALFAYYEANTATILGMAATFAKASISNTLSNFTFTVQHQYLSKLSDKSYDQLPLPAAGANSGVGGVAIADIFANAESLDAEDAISGEGFVIPYADLAAYGGEVPVSIAAGQDNRDLLAAISRGVGEVLTIRDATTASAVTANTQSTAATFTLPAAATAAVDPTTGILASEVDKIATTQMTTSYTIQILLNQAAQTFDVAVATT